MPQEALVRGDDTDPPPDAPQRPSAQQLAGRIQELLHEMRHARIAQLQQICTSLQACTSKWSDAPLAAALSALHSAGRELHFLPLRQGWVARLLGRHRAAYPRFAAAFGHMAANALRVKTHVHVLASTGEESISTMRRTLQELGPALDDFDKLIVHGVTWLQDMCTQLADARARGSEDPALASLAEAAQRFTQEFKHLQAVGTTAADVLMRGNTVQQRRTALLAQVESDMRFLDETWMPRLSRLVADLKAQRNPGPVIPKAIEVHDELMKRLSAAVDACDALRQQHPLLAQQLAGWQEDLDGPAQGS